MTEKVKQQHMFSNKMIAGILIPVVLEQLLNSIMGTADTMMVSNIGSAAISAVSLVDSINILVIQAFSALAAGGAIVCSQYIGQQNKKMANESARQVLFIITAISIAVSVLCLGFKKPLLRLIFGSVEADVMRASETYFFYTAISFPFIAAYDSAASIFRAQENTKGPMLISMISNAMNIVGNAIMIWICGCGNFYTGLPYILCSGSIDSIKKRPAANCGKRLPENPSGLGDDPENTRDWNSVRCGKQYVPAWKTGDTVYRINIRYNCNRSPGNDKYSGESEWNGGNRSWRRVDDNCRSVYGSGQKRRGGLLHKKIKCDRRSGNHCKLPAGICIDQACDSSWRHGACKCKDVFPYGNLDYACEADCMDAGICSGIRTSCGGRRKIFYDHVVSGHVAVPILSVRDTDPISGIWTDGRLDRYVCRLDSACSNIYMEIP